MNTLAVENGRMGGNGKATSAGVLTPRKPLEQMLVEASLISPENLENVLALQEATGRSLGELLVEGGLITPEDLAMVVSLQTRIPFIDLRRHKVDHKAIEMIPESMARKYAVLPLEIVDNTLVLVMQDPENIQAIEDLAAQSRMRIEPALGVPDDILKSIDINYKASAEISEQVNQIVTSEDPDSHLPVELIAQTPVVRVVDLIISQAVKDRASDIHIVPQEDRIRVRFRIDGILHDTMSLPLSVHPALISRLKILAGINIAERRRPQDGQFSVSAEGKTVDIRVATIETLYGELVVLRVLDKSLVLYTLEEIGLLAETLDKYHRMLSTPYGMILISGPTGSGKTTTMYASINDMDRYERNIMTIEDPVEYRFQDISPIQVNNRAGITFATGLRAVLRLDPDAIMVGEIRDQETAQIAIQAALTGHLVLSSIHANDAVGVLFRLMDLGVESFLISSALIGVVAQRMVRRVCLHCRALRPATEEERAAYKQEMGEELEAYYCGVGCNLCANTGYLGRTAVYEVMSMTDEARRKLLQGASASEIRAQVLQDGMKSMRQDAMMKVKAGITTPYEIMRNVFSIGGVEGSPAADTRPGSDDGV